MKDNEKKKWFYFSGIISSNSNISYYISNSSTTNNEYNKRFKERNFKINSTTNSKNSRESKSSLPENTTVAASAVDLTRIFAVSAFAVSASVNSLTRAKFPV